MAKLVQLVLAGVLLSAAIIGVVVLLTPMSETTPEEILTSNALEAVPVPAAAKPTLELPTVRMVTETKALQEELRTAARAMVERFPQDSGSWHLAAQVESELSQSEKAEQYWGRCLELKPRHFGPYLGLAELLTSKGRFQDATQVLQRVFELGGSTGEVYLKLGQAYENQGMLKEGLEALTTGAKLFPQDPSLLFGLGRLQAQSGQLIEAESNLKRAIALDGENKQNLSTLVNVLMRLEKRDEAFAVRETLKKITSQEPATGKDESAFQVAYDAALSAAAYRIFEGCGSLCYQQKQLALGEKYFLRAVAQDPTVASGWVTLSEVLLHQSKYADAIAATQRIVELEPENIVYRVNLASVAMKVGDFQLAESSLADALKIEPDSELILVALVKLYASGRRFDKAREALAALKKLSSADEVLQLTDYLENAASLSSRESGAQSP